MDADGGGEHALTAPRAGSSDAQPAFSPDGNQIVFDRLVGGPPAGEPLMVIDASGRGERAITPAAEFFSNADWQLLHSTGAQFAERCLTRLAGTARVDTLTGTAGPDLIDGLAGNDRIRGGAGDDCLNGGQGRDRIAGAGGDDVLTGGPGNDVLGSGAGDDKLAGGPGDDALNVADGGKDITRCGAGNDTVRADAADRLSGCEQIMRAETR
jgi:Ca2+-binding RTX toxin-like protein